MSSQRFLFPLNAVVFPQEATRLHIFEERYRYLVNALLEQDPTCREFVIVAIREGYEVGEHGASSFHTIGTLVQITDVEPYDDGRFDISLVGLRPVVLQSLLPYAPGHPAQGLVADLPDHEGEYADHAIATGVRHIFEHYRARLAEVGPELDPDLPTTPRALSWTLARRCLFNLSEQQALLESPTPHERLRLIEYLVRRELRALAAIPSLPATDIARTRWSPN